MHNLILKYQMLTWHRMPQGLGCPSLESIAPKIQLVDMNVLWNSTYSKCI